METGRWFVEWFFWAGSNDYDWLWYPELCSKETALNPIVYNYKLYEMEPSEDTIPRMIDGINLIESTKFLREPIVIATGNDLYGLYLVQNHIVNLMKNRKLNVIWVESESNMSTIRDLKMLLWQLRIDIVQKSNRHIIDTFLDYFRTLPTILVFNKASPNNEVVRKVINTIGERYCFFKVLIISDTNHWDNTFFVINLDSVYDQYKAFSHLYELHSDRLKDMLMEMQN